MANYKSKSTASLLAIFLGGLGAHKFYLGQSARGFLYLGFCWTFIPTLIGACEGIFYLITPRIAFDKLYNRNVVSKKDIQNLQQAIRTQSQQPKFTS